MFSATAGRPGLNVGAQRHMALYFGAVFWWLLTTALATTPDPETLRHEAALIDIRRANSAQRLAQLVDQLPTAGDWVDDYHRRLTASPLPPGERAFLLHEYLETGRGDGLVTALHALSRAVDQLDSSLRWAIEELGEVPLRAARRLRSRPKMLRLMSCLSGTWWNPYRLLVPRGNRRWTLP